MSAWIAVLRGSERHLAFKLILVAGLVGFS